ncbi:MAG: MBL fold metallo-hydrolase [Phycisphaerae bacterium]|nr:MBL fold metallo-hydrolase [Phycisphaerae bacterium]
MRLCVLASGSSGNCSALVIGEGDNAEVVLIDLGLSPRRTRKELAAIGIDFARVRRVLFTHFDSDHFHTGWIGTLPRHMTQLVHRRHLGRGGRENVLANVSEPYEGTISLGSVTVHPQLVPHDELGSVSFRFESSCGGTLGYATDLGRVSADFINHLAAVDVLAIESNYCPRMELESDRPAILKKRVMGGKGHLSNQESAEAARRIAPRQHVVLLHLSRQCNTPQLAAAGHAGRAYQLTISRHDQPTPWIPIAPPCHPRVVSRVPATLFE